MSRQGTTVCKHGTPTDEKCWFCDPGIRIMANMIYGHLDENHKVIPCSVEDYLKPYAVENFHKNKRVALDIVDGFTISTVFLAINHGFDGRDLWFETMVFKNDYRDLYQERYETWDEALEGHKKAVNLVKQGEINEDSDEEKTNYH